MAPDHNSQFGTRPLEAGTRRCDSGVWSPGFSRRNVPIYMYGRYLRKTVLFTRAPPPEGGTPNSGGHRQNENCWAPEDGTINNRKERKEGDFRLRAGRKMPHLRCERPPGAAISPTIFLCVLCGFVQLLFSGSTPAWCPTHDPEWLIAGKL